MTLTRRSFILTAGSALAGAVFVPKYERWFKPNSIEPIAEWAKLPGGAWTPARYYLGFNVTQEMLDDDLYSGLWTHKDGSRLYVRS